MLRYGILTVVTGLMMTVSAPAQESARIVRLKAITDVVRGGQKGMVIQLDSEIDRLKDRQVVIRALFYTAANDLLLARPGAYSTSDGFVTTQVVVTSPFALTNVKNTELFIPYDELSLGIRGIHCLKFRVQVLYFNGFNFAILDQPDAVSFVLIQP
jgi:hypothetical protein